MCLSDSFLKELVSLAELNNCIVNVLKTHNFSYDILFIDDGSTDASWSIIDKLSKENPNVKGIRFLRNYGKSQALHAGFAKVKGDVVILWMLIYKTVRKKFQLYTIKLLLKNSI
jgi:glycosyltransferase involved in cell wall biosynthesis